MKSNYNVLTSSCLLELSAKRKEEKQLLGALIGLARAIIENDLTTSNSEIIINNALNTFFNNSSLELLNDEILKVKEEKKVIAPDCAICFNPCGRTEDYNIDIFFKQNIEIQKAKIIGLYLLKNIELNINKTCEILFKFGYDSLDIDYYSDLKEMLKNV